MDHILTIRLYAAGIGIVVGEFLGSFDDLLYALVAFVVTDYVTGVLRAVVEKKLSSAIGFFYISNEGISIIENAERMGLPVPQKLQDMMHSLRDK